MSVTNVVAKHHLDKASQLEKQYHTRKLAGEKRIWKSQEELNHELARIQTQIDSHKEKAKLALERGVALPSPRSTCGGE